MKIEVNNLVYDSADKNCKCILSDSHNKIYAFVQALDVEGGVSKKPFIKRYWGEFQHCDPENSIRSILTNGGKWPSLPK